MRRTNPCRHRLVTLTIVGFDGREVAKHYAAPADGRPLDDLTLGELRPWPAMDAEALLRRVFGEAAMAKAPAVHERAALGAEEAGDA